MPQTYRNQVVEGDARLLARRVPPQSIDMIFVDPVYQNLDDYRWLARLALRVLRPKGMMLVWCSKPKLARSQIAMEKAGLEYVYTLDYTVVAKSGRMRWYNLFCWTTPCLWLQLPGYASRPRRWIPDTFRDTILLEEGEEIVVRQALGNTFISTEGPSGAYVWNKNLRVLKAWADAFCPEDGVILDTFAGLASVAAAATLIGRNHVSFEIKPDVAEAARERLALVEAQPMLDLWAEQQQLTDVL